MTFRILHYKTLDSTNNLAIQFARAGAAEGTVVSSEFQTKGRGRLDRSWISPRGKGLLFSVILRPKFKAQAAPILTQLTAEAVRDALVSNFKILAKLKKPNDVLVDGKKICGILTESSATKQKLDYVVVGIGLNVNSAQKELIHTATSIFTETKKKVEKEPLLLDILGRLNEKYEKINQ